MLFLRVASLSLFLICFSFSCLRVSFAYGCIDVFLQSCALCVACNWLVHMMCGFVCVASGSLFYYAFDVTIPIGWDLTCDIFLV